MADAFAPVETTSIRSQMQSGSPRLSRQERTIQRKEARQSAAAAAREIGYKTKQNTRAGFGRQTLRNVIEPVSLTLRQWRIFRAMRTHGNRLTTVDMDFSTNAARRIIPRLPWTRETLTDATSGEDVAHKMLLRLANGELAPNASDQQRQEAASRSERIREIISTEAYAFSGDLVSKVMEPVLLAQQYPDEAALRAYLDTTVVAPTDAEKQAKITAKIAAYTEAKNAMGQSNLQIIQNYNNTRPTTTLTAEQQAAFTAQENWIRSTLVQLKADPVHAANPTVMQLLDTDQNITVMAGDINEMVHVLGLGSQNHASGVIALDAFITAHADESRNLYRQQLTQGSIVAGIGFAKNAAIAAAVALHAPAVIPAIAVGLGINYLRNRYILRNDAFAYTLDQARGKSALKPQNVGILTGLSRAKFFGRQPGAFRQSWSVLDAINLEQYVNGSRTYANAKLIQRTLIQSAFGSTVAYGVGRVLECASAYICR